MGARYISPSVIRRLPKYHRRLRELLSNGVVRVSSSVLANDLGLTASQVRQDLNCFGGFGQQGYGYNVESLLSEIASIIGVDRHHTAAIIGVGNLGHALINNFNFKNCGFNITAAFDTNPELIGTEIGGITVSDAGRIAEAYAEKPFEVAVIAVPKAFARETAELAVKLGVHGIWNFANVDLNEFELGVKIENVHFADSLMTLCYKITEE